MSWIIIKYIKTKQNERVPVLMLDTNEEIWEFKNKEEAEHIADLLTLNSTTGKEYEVKKV